MSWEKIIDVCTHQGNFFIWQNSSRKIPHGVQTLVVVADNMVECMYVCMHIHIHIHKNVTIYIYVYMVYDLGRYSWWNSSLWRLDLHIYIYIRYNVSYYILFIIYCQWSVELISIVFTALETSGIISFHNTNGRLLLCNSRAQTSA